MDVATALPTAITAITATSASRETERPPGADAATGAGLAIGANAVTIGPTGIGTSLDSPSSPPQVRPGDGPFQPG
ncbi:MAG TPA: hypothetical protein VF491_22880, partial [Vicinamibacterales bacterium]